MSNPEILREAYRLLNEERRIDPTMYADDFVLIQSEMIVGTRGTFRGADGVQAALEELLEGFEEVRFEPLEFEEHGDWVVISLEWRGTVLGVEQAPARVFHLWRMRDGRAVSMRVFPTLAEALAGMEQVEA